MYKKLKSVWKKKHNLHFHHDGVPIIVDSNEGCACFHTLQNNKIPIFIVRSNSLIISRIFEMQINARQNK